jgi:hypothetical protein
MKYRLKRPSQINRSRLLATLAAVAVAGILVVSITRAAKPAGSGNHGGGSGKTASSQLYLSPAKSSVSAGQTFTVQVHANSGTQSVNAVQADLSYPADKLSFVSLDDSTSAFTIKAIGDGSTPGTVHIARGNTTALTGDQLVATVTFTAKPAKGAATVSFLPSSALVTSDSHANIATTTSGGTYSIAK